MAILREERGKGLDADAVEAAERIVESGNLVI